MLNKLRSFDCDRLELEELVELLAYGKMLRAEFEVHSEVPEWLDVRLRELRREISTRNQDNIDKRLRTLKARREALLPDEEKRTKLDAEIAALEQKAGSVS